jgi:segregation and condensation protein B
VTPAPSSAQKEPAADVDDVADVADVAKDVDGAEGAKTDANVPCGDLPLSARVEALLISADRPLAEKRLAESLGLAGSGVTTDVRAAIDELNASYRESARAFTVERLAGGWQILTRSEFGPVVSRGQRDRAQSRLSPAAMETLAIISYRQPLLRAEAEAIRGVACGEVLRGLLERRLVKIVGRAEELGRPMLYGTTKEFLKLFGLSSLDDLPTVEGLEPPGSRPRRKTKAAAEPAESAETPEADAPRVETPETPDAETAEAGTTGDQPDAPVTSQITEDDPASGPDPSRDDGA